MRRLTVFNSVTLDGYFTGEKGDLSWAHEAKEDPEWQEFVGGNASGEGELVFGRVTYEMMLSYWPTPQAKQDNPDVARGMNALQKLVFSRTLTQVSWTNTRLIKGDLVSEMRQVKQAPGKDLTILGSGTLVAQLAAAGLIDEYNLVFIPVVLGRGRTMFEGLKSKLALKRTKSRAFANGNVLVSYEPVA